MMISIKIKFMSCVLSAVLSRGKLIDHSRSNIALYRDYVVDSMWRSAANNSRRRQLTKSLSEIFSESSKEEVMFNEISL